HAPNVALLIAGGDDGEKSRLQSMIQELGLQENAFLVGHLEGKDRSLFLANADLFILCSHSENFGNVIVEAMAAGVPVVASTGTPWRSVEERGAGRWVAPEPAALCAAILDLLARDAADLGARARAHAADFDWGKIGDIHISTY